MLTWARFLNDMFFCESITCFPQNINFMCYCNVIFVTFSCMYLRRCHKDRPVRQTDQHLSRSVSALYHCAKNVLACVGSEVTGYKCSDACATRNNLFLCLFSDAVLTACVKQHKEQKSREW
jgi:hypothetical protein